VGTDSTSLAQFNHDAFIEAAQLLADAECSAILWNGTSGMFVGDLDADRSVAKAMSDATGGIPCSTNTIATVAALEFFEIQDVGIAVPYTPELTAKVREFFSGQNFRVHAAVRMDITPAPNREIAKCSNEEIESVVRKAAVPEAKAILVACTNWPATLLVSRLEDELDTIILDSIAVTLWEGLRIVGYTGKDEDLRQWGRLFAHLGA
jgi:maleate isomerase